MNCDICGKQNDRLIQGVCEQCDPVLHAAYQKAVESMCQSEDHAKITSEAQAFLDIMESRTLYGIPGASQLVGILGRSVLGNKQVDMKSILREVSNDR
jgi:hypothetical protein